MLVLSCGNSSPEAVIPDALKTWHFMLGLSVLALVIVRWVINVVGPFPLIKPAPPAWLAKPAILMHLLLYAFMILMPLLGWLILSADGKPIPFFGLQLPALIEADQHIGGFIQEVHEVGGIFGYFLIGLHTVAALFHHIFLKDNTLKRMLFNRD